MGLWGTKNGLWIMRYGLCYLKNRLLIQKTYHKSL